jgi:Pentapeptide repeats (9 copies)
MPDSPTSEPESDFVCACEEWMRPACTGQPFFREHQGKQYCVLHFPGKEKSADFERVLQRKLTNNDFVFRGVWFPDNRSFSDFSFTGVVDFRGATFSGHTSFNTATFAATADFRSANFHSNVSFRSAVFSEEANFRSATFLAFTSFRFATFHAGANFSLVHFKNKAVSFSAASFGDVAIFRSATFCAAAFRSSTFSAAADFDSAIFTGKADFSSTTFADRLGFAGTENRCVFTEKSSLDLQLARIEKPDCVSFHTLSLRPNWFVKVDSRKFEFTNVSWNCSSIDEEVGELKGKRVSSPHSLLATACQCLAINAENNNRYEEASTFRYTAMEARRLESWRGFVPWRLSWWYWLGSGYGERIVRAFLVLLGIWLLAGLLYTRVGFARSDPRVTTEPNAVVAKRDEMGASLNLSRALTYSAGVMTLQKPEPRPTTTAAQTLVLFETILGPVQTALLALAIRRKFMS